MSTTAPPQSADILNDRDAELREFMLVVRRALLLIVKWIEKTYVV